MSASSRFTVAVHSLCLLQGPDGERVSSDWIAGSVGTNPVVVRRTLAPLESAGIVDGLKGPRGGYRLLKIAAEVTLGDVYRATRDQGPLALHASEPNPKCPVGRCIQGLLEEIYNHAEGAMEASLDRTTLLDLGQMIHSAPE